MKRRPISLSDHQLQFIKHAARALPVTRRDQFLRDVAARLVDEPSDAAVTQVINVTLDRVPVFLNDAQPKEIT